MLSSSTVATDAEGYLVDPAQWSEDFAEKVAQSEGITLTEEHWKAIRFMRGWLEEHGVAPDARHVMKFLAGGREAGRARHLRAVPLWLRKAGVQDRGHEEATCLEHRLSNQALPPRAKLGQLRKASRR